MDDTWLLLLNENYETLDKEVQQEVFLSFHRLIYYRVLYITNDYAATQDIIQEAFMKTLQYAFSDEDTSHLVRWIRVVARNLAINYINKYNREHSQEKLMHVYYNEEKQIDEPFENIIEVKQLEKAIEQHVSSLLPVYQLLILMRWKEGLSTREIAERLDTTEAAVKQKLYRARTALKKIVYKNGAR